MKWVISGIVIIVIFAVAGTAIWYFEKDSETNGSVSPVQQFVDWVEDKEKPDIPSPTQAALDRLDREAEEKKQEEAKLQGIGLAVNQCLNLSIEKVDFEKEGEVYAWIDTNGLKNYSDIPPISADYEISEYAGSKILDYFDSNINLRELPYQYKNELKEELRTLYLAYGSLLDIQTLKKVPVNLNINRSEFVFEQARSRYAADQDKLSDSFYSDQLNQANILYRSNEETKATVIEQASYIVNRRVVGALPTWLQTGLLEYFKQARKEESNLIFSVNEQWTTNSKFNADASSLTGFFVDGNLPWRATDKIKNTATSWAFVHFMMDDVERKKNFAKLIKREQENLCDVLTLEDTEAMLTVSVGNIEEQFRAWLTKRISPQTIAIQ